MTDESLGVGATAGLTYGAAWRMWKNGKLPTGTIIIDERPAEAGVALYAQGSAHCTQRKRWQRLHGSRMKVAVIISRDEPNRESKTAAV